MLALAHHHDDQAETFLLRALRGSGVDGLAAIRPWRPFAHGWLWRPLLDIPRAFLRAYARSQDLAWIEDPSNLDDALDRGYLRRHVLPRLRARWPQADAALARTAALAGEASDLLAAEDAAALQASAAGPAHLRADMLLALPVARRARVLRAWIASLGLPPLPAGGLRRIDADLLHAAPDAHAQFAWQGAWVRRWRDGLHAGIDPPFDRLWQARWDGRAPLALPDGGALALIGAAAFDAPLEARLRSGGERIVLPGRRHSHALKHLLQETGVPPWLRARMPVLRDATGAVQAAGDAVIAAPLDAWLQARGAFLRWTPG